MADDQRDIAGTRRPPPDTAGAVPGLRGSTERPSRGCLDDTAVLLLVEGRLTGREREDVEAHLDACESCRRLVGAAADPQFVASARTASATEDVVGRAEPIRAEEGAENWRRRGAFVGRYLVLSLIGSGAMGRVYSAHDPQLDRRVAVKLLSGRESTRLRQRLVREARALGKLSHPNVVQVYEFGFDRDNAFVAMEYVDGQSLAAWQTGTPKPSWQAVLETYIAAARGLSAAHAEGLVHRDVKPANILRGRDGRVRVADFGLAANALLEDSTETATARSASPPSMQAPDASETEPAPWGGSYDGLGGPLTADGAVVGTLRYMAPEQQEFGRATALSDQYSLCVALYLGLYGVLPYSASEHPGHDPSFEELLQAKKAGPPAREPVGSPVPSWIHGALVRGLAAVPGDRHPSMDALIAALVDDPRAGARAWGLRAGLVAGALALVAVGAVGWARAVPSYDPCAHLERELAGSWDDGTKLRLRDAFRRTGRAYADDTADRVESILGRFGADWTRMRAEVCSASLGTGSRREVLSLRDACLDRRRSELKELSRVLTEGTDVDTLDNAVTAASRLTPISSCADSEGLTARVRPPTDTALRARVDQLLSAMDRLQAMQRAGRYKEGLTLADELVAETADVPYAPLRAAVQYWAGRTHGSSGDYAGARTLLQQSVVTATGARDDALAARAWAYLLQLVGQKQQRFDEATVVWNLGMGAIDRAQDESIRAEWLSIEASVLSDMGKGAEARALAERAAEVQERLAPDAAALSDTLAVLGLIQKNVGDTATARATLERAVDLAERALGPNHPSVSLALLNLGDTLVATGDYPRAMATCQRALSIAEVCYGPGNPNLAFAFDGLGTALDAVGNYAEALSWRTRSTALRERILPADHTLIAYSLGLEGRTAVRAGQLEPALALLERSRRIAESTVGPSSPFDALPLEGLGELALARHRPEQAEALLERAERLDESDPLIPLTLAEAVWQVGRDRLKARAAAERAQVAFERQGNQPEADRASRWLAEHR